MTNLDGMLKSSTNKYAHLLKIPYYILRLRNLWVHYCTNSVISRIKYGFHILQISLFKCFLLSFQYNRKLPLFFQVTLFAGSYWPNRASLVAQTVKNPPAKQETRVQSLGWEKEMAIHSSILPGEFHGQRSLAGYNPRGRRVRHD